MVRTLAHHHAPSLLQAIAVSDYKKQQPVGYFSLPAEIRNMIMELVLVPGAVPLNAFNAIEPDNKPSLLQGTLRRIMERVSIRSDKELKITRIHQLPGFQLLATCKQACAEGHTVFYSSNEFFLLQVPLGNTHHGLETLQPQHRAMIKQVGIMMTLSDMTPAALNKTFDAIQLRCGDTFVAWQRPENVWKDKLNFVLRHWEDFVIFKTTTARKPEKSDSTNMAENVEVFREEDDDIFWSPHVRSVRISSLRPAIDCRLGISDIIRNESWKALRGLVD